MAALATRLSIVSFAGELPDLAPTLQRLFRNQEDLGNSFKPFFGERTGNELTALLKHLDGTLEEATHRLEGDFEADIQDYDEAHDHILAMADFLSCGIIKKFPDQFKKNPGQDAICP
ncbi:hypothetical protein [Streptomyces sp. NPDC089799]|uniref:hypothetical protein n=1 Tax=Streptomyces sp. NPDC089799 TaxID=3155066 RepID=UPI00341BE48B